MAPFVPEIKKKIAVHTPNGAEIDRFHFQSGLTVVVCGSKMSRRCRNRNAHREQVHHSQREGLSVGQSSSSVSDRTRQPVVETVANRDGGATQRGARGGLSLEEHVHCSTTRSRQWHPSSRRSRRKSPCTHQMELKSTDFTSRVV